MALLLAGLLVVHAHDARRDRESALERDLAARAQVIARLSARQDSASVRVVHDSVTVTRTRTAYQTIRDTLILQPVTRADTVSALDQLPVFARTADSAIAACSEFQVSCARYRQVSDSLVVSLKDEREALQRRVKQLEPSGFRRFLRQATPIAAFVGGVYLGTRATR